VNPRRLRQTIAIQHLVAGSPAYSASGESLAEWMPLYENVPAEWVTLSGRALFAAQEHNSEVRGIWRMRWRDGVTPKMRIVDRGLFYDILWVPPYDKQGKRVEMALECSEGLSNG
jgi:SPP1 family predicted phage head-tail adaptor